MEEFDEIQCINFTDPRILYDLAAAIRKGDTGEAEYQLDKLAADIGAEAIEAVEIGRFSPSARRVA